MSILGVIPARGGSKGIPKKNITDLCGKPLIAYTCEAAKGSRKLTQTILSTDSKDIADVATSFGIDVPSLRPKELATDETPMIDVLKHLLSSQKEMPEIVVLLQPTSPLRTSKHIDEAIELFLSKKADTVVSVMAVPHQFSPSSLMNQSDDGRLHHDQPESADVLRRQDKQRLFARNGPAILIMKSSLIMSGSLYGEATYGYVMDAASSLDIDNADDLMIASALLSQQTR